MGGQGHIQHFDGKGVDPAAQQYLPSVTGTTSWATGAGVAAGPPLPFGSTEGDSGSPYFVWEDGAYKFLSTHRGSKDDNKQTLSCEAVNWTQALIEADSVRVDMGSVHGSLKINGAEEIDDKGGVEGVFNGATVNVVAAKGFLSDDVGNLYDANWNPVAFNGVATGQHTWKSLSALKDTDNWYAYGNEYLNATGSVMFEDKKPQEMEGVTYAKLFLSQNLVFEAAEDRASYSISVTKDTDLGAGYLHFAANGHKNVQYHVSSSSSENCLLNSAGYVVDAGVQVIVSLRNADADYMHEWRKVGEGELRLCGEGKNEIFLNVGRAGLTVLAQKNGYAAYNVMVNTGSTNDTKQIARDLSFGNGAGTDTGMCYSGNISGPGSLVIVLGSEKAALTLAGSISGLSELLVKNQSTVYVSGFLEADWLKVEDGSELLVQSDAEIAAALTSSSGQEIIAAESLTLTQYGGAETLVLEQDSRVLQVTSSLLNGVALSAGSTLSLDLSALGDVRGYEYICVDFNGKLRSLSALSLSEQVTVTAKLNDGNTLVGYYTADNKGVVYFAAVPEPTTGTLALLALSLLCARRRR